AENALLCAERMQELARVLCGTAPVEDLGRAWRGVLFNQFHDILAGTSLEAAYDDARDLHGEALAIAARAQNHALQGLSWRIGIDAAGGKPIAVFNPHPWPARLPIELEYGGFKDGQMLVDDSRRPVALQVVQSGATVASGRKRLAFTAELPALGWRVYRVVFGEMTAVTLPLRATHRALENRMLRVELDGATGCPSSIVDRRSGKALLSAPARAVVYDDPSDTWSHGVSRYDREVGAFEAVSARVMARGPVLTTVRVESAFRSSRLAQEFTLDAELAHLHVRVELDWREPRAVLKFRFPTALAGATATFEAPYGFVERAADGEEQPGQSWLDLSVAGAGLALLNDGKYSFDVTGSDIGMTVLRSPIYAHHDPLVPDEGGVYRHIDIGPQVFSYALVPHAGSWRDAGIPRRAAELNLPAIPIIETCHPGPLPSSRAALSVDPPSVALTVLKRAEDGDDLIVRCVETHGARAAARIDLTAWNRVIEAELGPLEIKTFCVPRDPAAPVREVDLLERLLEM